jgi:hypothetical protein
MITKVRREEELQNVAIEPCGAADCRTDELVRAAKNLWDKM